MVNRSLGNLLRCLTKKYSQIWDTILPQAEFFFNDFINRSTCTTPFQVVYGLHPKGPLELRELPTDFKINPQGQELAELITKVQQQVKDTLQKFALKYKENADKKRKEVHFKIGDKVWAFLRKERLPKGRYSKLQMKKVGPCTY